MNKTWLLIFTLIACSSFLLARKHSAPGPIPKSDTGYVKILKIPVSNIQATEDSINFYVLSLLGKSLTVDQSEAVKKTYSDMRNRLYQSGQIDSVRISKPKK